MNLPRIALAAALLAATVTPSHAAPKPDLPTFDPAKFHGAPIDNPFLPLRPGATWSYASHTPDGVETTDTEVTLQSKSILGIMATVVHDVVRLNGGLIEDTFDWYAQDEDGNVWYLGEDTKEYDGHGGFLNSTGSWEAGVAGAQAGIVMLAHLEKGLSYPQEFLAGVAEDHARITDLAGSATVPAGSYGGLLVTLEWTPLEPGAREYKSYAPGIGLVLEEGKKERVELVSANP